VNERLQKIVVLIALLALVALVYWPIRRADFVWDDVMCFHDAAWLRVGDDWKHYVLSGFCDWTNYFRPLLVLLFTVQLRLFDANAAPMHMVSLAMHLANTLLVAILARSFLRTRSPSGSLLAAIAAVIYGLHPALLEPIVWINTQTELMVVFWMLAGLLCNATTRSTTRRALAVATCFFLAACSKESAVTFPLILVLFDWLRDRSATAAQIWRRQRIVYLATFAAGVTYLALRAWALGYVLQPAPITAPSLLARVREVAFIYMTYWRILLVPMFGSGPIHLIVATRFATWSAPLLAACIASISIFAAGIVGTCRRNLAGAAIVGITLALLPVLHIVPVAFDPSLYHERYVMMPLAWACSVLPAAALESPLRSRVLTAIAAATALVWVVAAALTIRTSLPLWSDEVALWQWTLRSNPTSLTAQDRLLAAYIDRGDEVHALPLASALLDANTACPFCALNGAYLSIEKGDLARAASVLERIRNDPTILAYNPRFAQRYIQVNGMLFEAKGDLINAEGAYRDAVAADPLVPEPQMALAMFLARQGRLDEARAVAARAIQLYAPDMRERRRHEFDVTASAIGTAR
jgi:hypothetical protein